jgi:hypothetical protein
MRKIKMACLLSLVVAGVMTAALPVAMANPVVSTVKVEKEWKLIDTKNGVTGYYNVGGLGTCNNGVYLRFVNASATDVTVDFSVMSDGVAINKKITVKAGQTLDHTNDPALAVRPLTAGTPFVTFTVSK